MFGFFSSPVEARYNASIMPFFKISAAILNTFYGKIFEDRDDHARLAKSLLERQDVENALLQYIEARGYNTTLRSVQWIKADDSSIPDFPKLSWEALKAVTLGV